MIARVYRVEVATVRVFDRWLKEAGLLTTGARGVNAPHMTPLDAARLSIALLSTDSPARAVERVQRFGAMPFRPDESTAGAADYLCLASATFEEALAKILTWDEAGGAFGAHPYVEVLENTKKATIRFDGFSGPVAVFRDHQEDDRFELDGIRRARGLASSEMLEVAVSIAMDAP